MEVCADDRLGLLSDLTSLLVRHNLSVTSATACTRGTFAVDEVVVEAADGTEVDVASVVAAHTRCSRAPGGADWGDEGGGG